MAKDFCTPSEAVGHLFEGAEALDVVLYAVAPGPGLAPLMASAAATMKASTLTRSSSWCSSTALTTSARMWYLRAMSAPISAWPPWHLVREGLCYVVKKSGLLGDVHVGADLSGYHTRQMGHFHRVF